MNTTNENPGASRPNILFIQVDQLVPAALSVHGHPLVKTPHLDELAGKSVVFENAYSNFPLCSPSRASMLAGRLPYNISQWDNGAEFFAEIPTLAHYLKALGYSTTLCGKMHFIGPDQFHGYEERLTTDIYPSDFSWTPNWDQKFRKGGGIRVRNVIESGRCVRALQMDFDDEVEYHAVQKIYDLVRHTDDRPFFFTVSLSHPHPPYVISDKYWDLYRDEDIDLPRVPEIPFEELDPFSQTRAIAMGHQYYDITDDHIRTARHAYYGMISYVDEKIGSVLTALKETGLDRNTVIIFTADHGEMLGERGMWLKDTFYEWSVRVPMFIYAEGIAPRRVTENVSLVDLVPTCLELAGKEDEPVTELDGDSLVGLMHGSSDGWKDEVISEWSATGHPAPSRMVRRGNYKYWVSEGLPPLLFDLENDPDELENVAGRDEVKEVEQGLRERLYSDWDPAALGERIRTSQKMRLLLRDLTETTEKYSNWAVQTVRDDSRRYVRGRASSFYAKALQRYPFVEPVEPDHEPPSAD